jgi:catechol 2,3-dioxygenase-like lactoylglutathione lyase family enzyme
MEIRQTRMVLRTKSFDRACRFYGEVLALPRLSSWDREDGRGACFQVGQAVIEVRGRPSGELGDLRDEAYEYVGPQHKITLTLLVPSPEEAYQELRFRDQNIPGGLRQDVDGAQLFETHDPDGVKILFRQSDQ